MTKMNKLNISKFKCLITFAFLALHSTLTCSQNIDGLVINEIMAANVDMYVDPSWNYGGWVEFYNASAAPRQLRGCWISDDPQNLKKVHITQSFMIYGYSFKNLWFGHHDKYCPSQMDMKLKNEGGTIYLSDSKGNLLLSQDYPTAIPRSSWTRLCDGADDWGYSNAPTPEASNGNVVACQLRLDAPVVDVPSCIFDEPLTIRVNIPTNATLRYTTDGSTPTLKEGETSIDGEFFVNNTTIYRFALFREGYMSSPVITRSYLKKDKDFSLPIISIVTDSDHLYSDEMGIFVKGINGRPGLGNSSKCNWNMDWDRPVNFEYLDEYGNSLLNQEAEIYRCGGWTRNNKPYSFKIHASKIYEGNNSFNYPFFRDKYHNKYKTLQIRNGGNYNSGRVKDAFLQKLALTSDLNIDAQEYQPVAHYINGVYKGVINLREPNNKYFVEANYGLDEDEIDLFEIDSDSGYVQKCGTREAYERWYNLSKTASNRKSYEEIEKLVDIDEYCNYMAVELYLGNDDWPQNNQKAWRPIGEDGRFRFIMFDMDGSFKVSSPFSTFANKKTYTFNTLYGESVKAWTKEIEAVTIFLNMLQNETFRRHFIDAFCLVAGSVYNPERCKELINEWTNYVYPMQILNDNGYGKNESPWNDANSLIESISNRATLMYSALKDYSPLKLDYTKSQKLKLSSNIKEARIRVNGQVVPTGKFDGQLFLPISLKAEVPAGYVFDGWNLVSGITPDTHLIKKGDSWTYYDKGSLDGKYWKMLGFGVSEWNIGQAPLGYGTASSVYNTIISYGNNGDNKYTTYYFRKNVTLKETPSDENKFILDFDVDDGMVVYVNGVEAGRYNMAAGEVTFNTVTPTSESTGLGTGSMTLSNDLFKKGINVVAVEIHNNSTKNSDIYWDASLTQVKANDGPLYFISKDTELSLPEGCSELVAHFSKINATTDANSQRSVVINEVNASNSVSVNEYFKKNDWIELYNTTDKDIDLTGMYLSDDVETPYKYRISNEETLINTIIPANGYCVVWCDELAPVTQLHAPFKLANKDNACVILTASDESWSDTLVYCSHNGMESVGRFPDGSSNIYHMSRPTIDRPNQMTMYSTPFVSKIEDSVHSIPVNHNGGLSLLYTHDGIRIRSTECSLVKLSIYTLEGLLEMSESIELEKREILIPMPHLKQGIHIIEVNDGNGNNCSCKCEI